MKASKNVSKELARDFLALGSIPFFILVLARIWILNDQSYFFQFVISGVLFLILTYAFKNNLYSGLGFIMLFFTVIYYNDLRFSVLGSLVYVGLIYSLVYLKYEKIILGFLFGALSTGIGYYAVKLIF